MASGDVERRLGWERDGFFIVPRMLSEKQTRELSEACDHVLQQVRLASGSTGHTTTHIAALLAPHYFAQRPEALALLTDFVSSRQVLSLVHDLGRAHEGTLNLRDVQYFHEPSQRDYDGAWHRDGDTPSLAGLNETTDADPGAERSTLLRFRVAFSSDDHLEYVPGSHARRDTPEELRIRWGVVRNAPLASEHFRVELGAGRCLRIRHLGRASRTLSPRSRAQDLRLALWFWATETRAQ